MAMNLTAGCKRSAKWARTCMLVASTMCWFAAVETPVIYPAAAGEVRPASQNLNLSAFSRIEARKLDVIVAVLDGSGSLQFREFGAPGQDRLPPEATLVDLGSITKTVTAVAILKLVEQGRIRLTDTLSSFWLDAPVDKASITVHQLLTHTSGLPEDVGHDEEPLHRTGFIARVLAEDLVAAPGTSFNYSNAGYGVLAAILELRTNTSFEDYLDHHCLRPTGLGSMGYGNAYRKHASLQTRLPDVPSGRARAIRDASWGGHDPGWNLIGNGGLVSTPATFLRFWRAVRRERIIGQASLRQMLLPHIPEPERRHSSYGYGLFIRELPDHGRIYGHDGGNDVFTAEWAELPDSDTIVFTAGLGEDAIDAMELILQYDRFPGQR